MSLYRKKPVTVEAMQWVPHKTDSEAYGEIVGWLCDNEIGFAVVASVTGDDRLVIATPAGDMAAEPGDWIVKSAVGEFYPFGPNSFEATYEKIEDGE